MQHHDTWGAANALTRFFGALDRNDYPLMADLIEGGIWLRRGVEIADRDSLMAAMADRSPTRIIRHLLTNITTEPGPNAVSVSAYMSVLQHDPGPDHEGPLPMPMPMPGFTSLRSVHARAVKTPAGWRLRRVWSGPVTFQAEARA
ncbi:MAG: nuclear transport factor 2 family protein [Pseudooceanicola atlanticus]